MGDVFDEKKRSEVMSKIRSKNTKPEIIVRKFLHASGFRFRLHDNKLPGNPDIKMTRYKTVILVHGCFWHGHDNCKIFKMPKTRTEYWIPKINRNIERGNHIIKQLKKEGWFVIVIWECQLHKTKIITTLSTLLDKIHKRGLSCSTKL